MSLIELALQRAKTSGNATDGLSAERAEGTGMSVNIASSRNDMAPTALGAASEAREPELMINELFLRERGLLAPAAQEHQQRAEYRHIKYGLLQEIRHSGANTSVFVTSALEGEGKTFSSVHLALSLASESDYTVVLVDADAIRPSLSRTFGLSDRPGLMDALTDTGTNVETLLVSTSVRGLSILPVGRPDERATEQFASARMREVMQQILSVPNRIAVVDTLPLLLTTEARALSSLGGQIVLVVRAENTSQNAVLQAIDLLGEGANVKLLLNAAVRSKAFGYFGLGYGYDYGNNKEKSL